MKTLLIDNYDSFTYNLVHLLKSIGSIDLQVVRNDKITLNEINEYDNLLISPGPGIPDEAGIIKEAIKHFAATKNILGVCLGHQAIAEVFGGSLVNMKEPIHGIASELTQTSDEKLFDKLPQSFKVGRYHSWQVDKQSLPPELLITAESSDGSIMALKHKNYNVKGLQFHPESVLTEFGREILQNWIN